MELNRSLRVGASFLLSAAAGLAVGASQAPRQPETPVFKAGVALVAVPVFVTDKSGKSVPGLTAEDFEVEDGGKRVPIVSFQAIDVDARPTAELRSEQAQLPVAVQAVAPRQFLLLIDMQFSPMAGLRYGRKAAVEFVRKELAPGDLVAAGTLGNDGLRMLANFTTDHEGVARAIEGKGLAAATPVDPLGLSAGIRASDGSGSRADEEAARLDKELAQVLKDQYRHRVTGFVDDLSNLVRTLARLRGRKQIVLLSAGFAESTWNQPPDRDKKAEGPPMLDTMLRLFREAGQSDVVLHTISLNGIEGANFSAGLEDGPRGEWSISTFKDMKDVANKKLDSGRGTLVAMAENTGGRFILPTNNFGKALREVDQISRQYYVIAFEATEPLAEGGRPRPLKVRVRGKGLSVSHRAVYAPPAPLSASGAEAARQQATEAISKGLSGGPLPLHLTTLIYHDLNGKQAVHSVLQFDGPALAEAAGGQQLAVRVYGYAMRDGRVLDSQSFDTSIDLSRFGAAVRSSGIRMLTAFPVSSGAVDLRFFVQTGDSGVTGSIQRSVTVPTIVKGKPFLSAPMFTSPPEGEVVIPFQPKDRPHIEIPFRLGNEPFVPDPAPALSTGRARNLCVFAWPARTDSKPPFEVAGEIAGPGGVSLPLRIEGAPRVIHDPDGFDRYVVTIVPPDATRGIYTLRLTFTDPATGQTTRSETSIAFER